MRRDHVISLMWIRPFHTGFQFHESAVIGDIHHPADHLAVYRVSFGYSLPGVRPELFDTERNALLGTVELKNFYGDFVAYVQHFGGMRHPAVRDVGDVQQAVDPAKIDKRTVFGEILNDAGNHRTFHQVFESRGLADGDFFLDRSLARNHHVAAAAIQLDDLDRDVLAHQGIQVVNRPRIGLRTGHEGLDADIDGEPAFHPPQHSSGDYQLFLVSLLQMIPNT